MNGHGSRMHLWRLTLARHLVRAAATNLHRAVDRRALQDIAGELRRKHGFDVRARRCIRGRACRAEGNLRAHALKVISVGKRREVNGGQVPLLRGHEPGNLLRAFAQCQHQDAGCQRIQRPRMSRANAARSSADDRHCFHA